MKSDLYYIYGILSIKDGRIYVGLTRDVEKRLNDHNSGKVFSTKGFCPWQLIYQEKVIRRERARFREKYFKSGCGKEFLKNIIPR